MKTYFGNIKCPSCMGNNDMKRGECEHCHADLGNPDAARFKNHLPFPFWKEIIFFVIGIAGLTLISLVVGLIQSGMVLTSNPGITAQEATTILSSAPYLAASTFISYGVLAAGIALLIFKKWKNLLASFKGWKPYVFALAGFAAIFAFEQIYSIIMNLICQNAGITPDANANQNAIVSLIGYAPVLCVLFLGIIGPFVEEMAYRVGLFGFTSRLGKPLGYVVSILIFGLIHFNVGSAFNFSPENYANAILEWLNLPAYLFSGLAFAFLYDKFGFACSYLAHATNNVFSIIVNIIAIRTGAQ